MKQIDFLRGLAGIFLLSFVFGGCISQRGNVGELQSFSFPVKEPEWIRNGEPIKFENEVWYPQDAVEIFLDSEVYLVGDFQKTQIFVDKTDVRPFARLYTKYDLNKFRYYRKLSEL
jgi:hypothetical protein